VSATRGRAGSPRSRFAATVVIAASVTSLEARVREDFATTPFDPAAARWCERYHHAHFRDGAIRFEPSTPDASQCDAGRREHTALSCEEAGCGPCSSDGPSPCSKLGDRRGNAVLLTAVDQVGTRRSVTAWFRIERPLVAPETHLGLYAALHPHCHTTTQAILVPDGGDRFHLNLAVFNQFIGGDEERHAVCRRHPHAEITSPLDAEIVLRPGVDYRWVLRTELDARGGIVAETTVTDARGFLLGAGRRGFPEARAEGWFGRPGEAARFAFGGQLGDPGGAASVASVILLRVDARASPDRPSSGRGSAGPDQSRAAQDRRRDQP
jgi:hypothetical protein